MILFSERLKYVSFKKEWYCSITSRYEYKNHAEIIMYHLRFVYSPSAFCSKVATQICVTRFLSIWNAIKKLFVVSPIGILEFQKRMHHTVSCEGFNWSYMNKLIFVIIEGPREVVYCHWSYLCIKVTCLSSYSAKDISLLPCHANTFIISPNFLPISCHEPNSNCCLFVCYPHKRHIHNKCW